MPARGEYVAMGELEVGTVLRTTDGSLARVVGSERRQGSFEVFNFEVEDAHNYYVSSPRGSPGVLVHNHKCGRVPRRYSVDEFYEPLNRSHLDAARREVGGEVVARRGDGVPYDHVREVGEARIGVIKRMNLINRHLGHPDLSQAERDMFQSELSRAGNLLENADSYLRNSGVLNAVKEHVKKRP